jgi:hypothetical protein
MEDNSPKAVATSVIEKIEDRTGVEINDLTPASTLKLKHLSMQDSVPTLTDDKANTAILVLGTDSASVISELNEKQFKSKDIRSYYKPRK